MKANTVMALQRLLSFFLWLGFLAVSDAFLAPARSAISLTLHLHPDQAADLEACAYDLMKQAQAQQAKERKANEDMRKSMTVKDRKISLVQRIWGACTKLKP